MTIDIEQLRADMAQENARLREALDAMAMRTALENIRELNMTAPDENGHRWAASDLIEQEIVGVFYPDHAAVLAEVRKVPEVRALVDAASEGIAAWRELLALYVGRAGKPDWHGAEMALISDVETAIAKLKGASHE